MYVLCSFLHNGLVTWTSYQSFTERFTEIDEFHQHESIAATHVHCLNEHILRFKIKMNNTEISEKTQPHTGLKEQKNFGIYGHNRMHSQIQPSKTAISTEFHKNAGLEILGSNIDCLRVNFGFEIFVDENACTFAYMRYYCFLPKQTLSCSLFLDQMRPCHRLGLRCHWPQLLLLCHLLLGHLFNFPHFECNSNNFCKSTLTQMCLVLHLDNTYRFDCFSSMLQIITPKNLIDFTNFLRRGLKPT